MNKIIYQQNAKLPHISQGKIIVLNLCLKKTQSIFCLLKKYPEHIKNKGTPIRPISCPILERV